MSTIAHRLRFLATEHGTHPAIVSGEEVVTYADLAANARRVSGALAELGVSKGTRVGILMPNQPDWLRASVLPTVLGLGPLVVTAFWLVRVRIPRLRRARAAAA